MITSNNLEFYLYYAHLNPTQRSVYNELLPAIDRAQNQISISTRCSSDDVTAALHAIIDDHPEIFWFYGSSTVSTRNGYAVQLAPKYNALAGNLAYNKRQLQYAVDSYLRPVNGLNPVTQIRKIHDAMAKNISYVHGVYDQTAYSSLVDRRSVCAGYSRGFQLLMQMLGIPCYICHGTAKGSRDTSWGPHSWNILKLGNEYYNMDLTWDDQYKSSSDHVHYTYYNCTDAKIAANHRRSPDCLFLPRCYGTRFSFEAQTGVSPELNRVLDDGVTCRTPVNTRAEFLRLFTQELRSRGRSLSISFPTQNSGMYDNMQSWISEAVRSVYGQSVGWSSNLKSRNYNNGWYRLEITLTISR